VLKLGKLELDAPFFQAALSGYSDRPMRLLAMEHGSPLTFTGVILSKVIMSPAVLRHPNFRVTEQEHPIGAQILGEDPHIMTEAARALVGQGYDVMDLNFACPAPKVLRRERGGSMERNPELVLDIFRRVRDAVQCPLLMKLRIGYDDSAESREKFWQICEGACTGGIDALIVHGRTVVQKYRDKADWQTVAEVKRRYPNTTIIGSGDLFTAETVLERLKQTGLDGVTIARGAVGNPWLFREIRALLEGKDKPAPPTIKEQGEMIKRHFLMVLDHHRRRRGLAYFRKFSINYCRRHPNRKKVQMALMAGKTEEEVLAAIHEWYGLN